MTEYIESITVEGDTWDSLAYKWYGSAYLFPVLVHSNPQIVIEPDVSGGQKLYVPVLDLSQTVSTDKLPPWKR